MLKIEKCLNILEKFLLIFLVILGFSTFYIRYKMYNLSSNLKFLDKKIEKLNNEKELLTIELTYLTSTERILALIEKNNHILNNKDIIASSQLKTMKEFAKMSLVKFSGNRKGDRSLAKNN